ncbi:TIGR04290 family methyltransferase [Nafulsella turpanensis]|uniref:TIGR04290 family methyltransferase n=1 Tax=Nafulsella turpanensis TaxID=1265690 RepID=UPI00034BEDA5|nr:TIGR04290 family methyltransferase [Nafulsella turpanensis]
MSTLEKEIEELKPWFHNLHLPQGIQTAPDHWLGNFPEFKWKEIADHIPQDLSGWRVLDVGCNAGFYSFELAKRGADVLGIDVDTHYLKQAEWAAEKLGLQDKVEFKQMQVYDLAREDEQFDLIWFMGVLYHLRYPMLALDILAEKNKDMMVFQTLSMPGDTSEENTYDRQINDRQDLLKDGWPKMAFIEHKFAGDPTNWWLPNHAGIEAMLRSCGYTIESRPGHEIYVARKDEQNQSSLHTWNRSEYQSATQQDWQAAVEAKIKNK